jgi:hypothetical protein
MAVVAELANKLRAVVTTSPEHEGAPLENSERATT